MYFVCRSLLEIADKVVLNVVDEPKDIKVAVAHKQEFISWCGGSRSSRVKDSLKGIVATYDTAIQGSYAGIITDLVKFGLEKK